MERSPGCHSIRCGSRGRNGDLCFIVDRILRELIELAERDADAELVAARRARCGDAGVVERVSEPRGPGPGLRRLGTFRRAERQVGAGLNRDCPLGRMVSERRWRVRGPRSRAVRARGGRRRRVPRRDDGRGGRGATAAGAVRGGGVPGAARRRSRRHGRRRPRLNGFRTWWR